MKYLKFILYVIIALLLIVIIVENHEPLSKTVFFRFDMFWLHYRTVDIPLYYIAAIPFLLGVIITGIFGIVERYKLNKQIKDLRKIIKNKDKEFSSLRNLSVTGDSMGSGDIDDMSN
ncbi:MAG: LapA family protein [Deltaproteobacteria bacterium]|nr:LapA family protein [Deltaproteobacteria bacterium]